jgi:hypothetical protein
MNALRPIVTEVVCSKSLNDRAFHVKRGRGAQDEFLVL